MNKKLKTGVIGCGVMGKRHCADIGKSELMELSGVADIKRNAAREAAGKGGGCNIYANSARLIKDPDIEAVVIAMPAAMRTRLAMKCLRAGKHVLLEKPVAMNSTQVKKMIAAGDGLTIGCFSSRYRFRKPAGPAADFIAAGNLGDIRVVRIRAIIPDRGPPAKTPPEWRLKKTLNGGGILMNWGCYDLDYMMWITGWKLKPTHVLAQTWGISPDLKSRAAEGSEAETHFCAFIKCENGAAITFERGEFMPAARETAWQITGSKGTLTLQMTPSEPDRIIFHKACSDKAPEEKIVWEGSDNGADMNLHALEDFAKAVMEKREPGTGLEKSLFLQTITDAIYKSSDTGRTVSLFR